MEDELDCKVKDCIVCAVGRPIANVLLTNTSWTSMLKLVLSVLHHCVTGQEYFGNNEITLFVKVHWDQIHGSKPWTDEFKSRVSDCLSHNPKCFESKERGKWRLKDKNLMPPLIAQLKKLVHAHESHDPTPLSPVLSSSSPSSSCSSPSSSPAISPSSSPVQTPRPRGRPPIYTSNSRSRELPCLDSSTKVFKRKRENDDFSIDTKCARSPLSTASPSPLNLSSPVYSSPRSPSLSSSSDMDYYSSGPTDSYHHSHPHSHPHRLRLPYYPSPPPSPTYISPRTPPYAAAPPTPSYYNSSYIPSSHSPYQPPSHPTYPTMPSLPSFSSLTLPPLYREPTQRWDGYRNPIDRGMVDMLTF